MVIGVLEITFRVHGTAVLGIGMVCELPGVNIDDRNAGECEIEVLVAAIGWSDGCEVEIWTFGGVILSRRCSEVKGSVCDVKSGCVSLETGFGVEIEVVGIGVLVGSVT
jgi:hypothetical protein